MNSELREAMLLYIERVQALGGVLMYGIDAKSVERLGLVLHNMDPDLSSMVGEAYREDNPDDDEPNDGPKAVES